MPKPSLMLNCIVKNESARIERALASAAPYVKAFIIHDTGSTDDTIVRAYAAAAKYNVPIHISHGEFRDFSQARNEAFAVARTLNGVGDAPYCQFALLMDADMELVVDDPAAFDGLNANALSYDMMQKGGTVSYANRRLVNLNWGLPPYVGVTHEYIDVQSAGMIKGARFVDHADGSNRADKYPRDARLLEEALKTEPLNARYWYYLGNTYRDWGKPHEATDAYEHQIMLGGWDEEIHSAMMNLACALKDADHPDGFVSKMVAAYNFRPRRAEPLYDLAKYYREKGDNAAALLFAKHGMTIPRPDDLLFVNDFVYSHGLRYEYSIVGYYDEKERARAFEVTDGLALDPTCPAGVRESARNNLYWHTKPLSHYCPSFVGKQLDFTAPDGYTAMNPSVVDWRGGLVCNIRCVNYKINEDGQYMIGPLSCHDAPIDTRNFVAQLDDNLTATFPSEIQWHRPPPAWDRVTGLEDIRLNEIDGELCFSATVREQLASGECQMVWGELRYDVDARFMHVPRWKSISDGKSTEKNWMPFTGGKKFVHSLGCVVDPLDGDNWRAVVTPTNVHGATLRGSSQLVPFKNGRLSVVHEAAHGPDGKRTYWHRFVWFHEDGGLHRVSLPFVFYDRQIEFCAGMALHPNGNDLVISFGVRDAEAHIATVAIEEVARMIWKYT
jgi:glycosyltransferase involved in cell wall biosynthesis